MTAVNTSSKQARLTTGIGSLPHHNIDSALEFSFGHGIPFLPQIPIRNPWEYMIAQALEALPGLEVEDDGGVTLNLDIWYNRARQIDQRLAQAFERASAERGAFEAFEPSSAVSSSWQAFVWELRERETPLAKVQIAGPMTAQWALRTKDHSPLEKHPELRAQIFRLVLARALAMTRRLQAEGIQPILYLDEPGLYGLSVQDPRDLVGLSELKLMIQTLKKEGVTVGLHCCSNTDWKTVLSLDLNYLSLDTALSLGTLLHPASRTELEQWLDRGGKLSLGIVPTGRSSLLHSLDAEELYSGLFETLARPWANQPDRIKKVLKESVYTPACGLALHSTSDAELILETLNEFYDHCSSALS